MANEPTCADCSGSGKIIFDRIPVFDGATVVGTRSVAETCPTCRGSGTRGLFD